jgi:hypothetical protein
MADGDARPVTIQIYTPARIDDYWACEFELIVAGQIVTRGALPGTDSFDALYMAMIFAAKGALDLRSRGTLLWQGRAEFLGLEELAAEPTQRE